MCGAIGTYHSHRFGHDFEALSYKDSVQVVKILRRLGCTQDKHPVRKDGKRRRWWHPPADIGVSVDSVPPLTAAVAKDLGELAHDTSGSSKKDSPPIDTTAEAAPCWAKHLCHLCQRRIHRSSLQKTTSPMSLMPPLWTCKPSHRKNFFTFLKRLFPGEKTDGPQ